jgi:hypothetical protein
MMGAGVQIKVSTHQYSIPNTEDRMATQSKKIPWTLSTVPILLLWAGVQCCFAQEVGGMCGGEKARSANEGGMCKEAKSNSSNAGHELESPKDGGGRPIVDHDRDKPSFAHEFSESAKERAWDCAAGAAAGVAGGWAAGKAGGALAGAAAGCWGGAVVGGINASREIVNGKSKNYSVSDPVKTRYRSIPALY